MDLILCPYLAPALFEEYWDSLLKDSDQDGLRCLLRDRTNTRNSIVSGTVVANQIHTLCDSRVEPSTEREKKLVLKNV